MKLKMFLNWAIYIVIFFIGVIALVEIGLRLDLYYVKKDMFKIAIFDHVQERIDFTWKQKRKNRKIFWGPPYNVYLNHGLKNKERMQMIFENSSLPKSGVWNSPNFLRSEKEEVHHYKINTNSLGFRDVERNVIKPQNTFRIIVLGAYPAFGHGVDNTQTYSYQLENILKQRNPHMNFEVWNGGMQGTVAIMGYSRLKYELTRYSPDLIIFDYGWVDFFMRKDHTNKTIKLPLWKRQDWTFLQKLGAAIRFHWFPSLAISKVIDSMIKKSFRKDHIQQWKNVMTETVAFSKSQKLPILFLRHYRETVWPELYKPFHKPEEGTFFLDTTPSFDNKFITNEIIEDFWSTTNWLTETGRKKEDVPVDANIYFKVDVLQFNKHGHKAIAKFITPQVEKILKVEKREHD